MEEQASAPPLRKPITPADLMRPEILLAIAGTMTLIAGAGSEMITVFVIGLAMLYSSAASLGYFTILRGAFPVLSISTVCGGVLFLYSLEQLARFQRSWPLAVALIAGLIGLFAAYVAYAKPTFSRA